MTTPHSAPWPRPTATPGSVGTLEQVPALTACSVKDVADRMLAGTAPALATGSRVSVPTNLGPIPLTCGVLNTAARSAYLHGQCHALALGLWERTGEPLLWAGAELCARRPGCDPGADTCLCQIDHLIVGRPGKLIDIHGPQNRIRYPAVRPLTAALLEQIAVHWFAPNIAAARSFVTPVLNRGRRR